MRAKSAEELRFLGNDEFKAKNYQGAIKLYTGAIARCPKEAVYYANRAASYMMLHNYKKALQDSITTIEIDPSFVKSYIRIVKCCTALGDVTGGERILEIYMRGNYTPELLSQLEESNRIFDQLREIDNVIKICLFAVDQIKYLDKALKIAPASLKYRVMKAEHLAKQGRTAEAMQIAERMTKIDQSSLEAIYIRAVCVYFSEDFEKSKQDFEKTLSLDCSYINADDFLRNCIRFKNAKESGNKYFKSKYYRAALDEYTDALHIDWCNPFMNRQLYFNCALMKYKMGDPSEAIADCSLAIEANSRYFKALVLRAKCYFELRKFKKCLADCESASKIHKTTELEKLLSDARSELKGTKSGSYQHATTHYHVLGVSENASQDDIKMAYHKKARLHHPDRHVNSNPEERLREEQKFKEVSKAYEILSDKQKRTNYDNQHNNENTKPGNSFERPYYCNDDDDDDDDDLFSYWQQKYTH